MLVALHVQGDTLANVLGGANRVDGGLGLRIEAYGKAELDWSTYAVLN